MARDKFRDGAEILATYEWAISHESEDPQEQTQNLERTALTSGVGFVRQQGAPTPKVYKLKGWATAAQIAKMQEYYDACAGIGTPSRTIFWTDISGTEYEVLITSFAPQRSVGRMIGKAGTLNYVFQYTIDIEIV